MNTEIVLFSDGDVDVEVQVSPDQETVWLTQKQMGILFGVKQATLSEHISKILDSGELDETSIGISDKSSGGRKPQVYNLDMILSVGYRVNSRGFSAFSSFLFTPANPKHEDFCYTDIRIRPDRQKSGTAIVQAA